MDLLSEHIERCEDLLDHCYARETELAFVAEARRTYRNEIRISRAGPAFAEDTYDLKHIRAWLKKMRDDRAHELAVEQAKAGNVSVNSVSQASAFASVEASFTNTMSQMWALPEDVLASDQKQELAKLLQAVEDSGKDEGRLKETAKAVADWAFDNAIKAIPTVMPFVTQAIQNAFGA